VLWLNEMHPFGMLKNMVIKERECQSPSKCHLLQLEGISLRAMQV
jgi:hypothetical protein